MMLSEAIKRDLAEAPKPQTLEPGHSCKCGPAMRAAIMERAKELGMWGSHSTTSLSALVGLFVMSDGMIGQTNSMAIQDGPIIPTHEFLRLMENTKPPVKELTTEERLAEAVKVIEDLEGNCYSTTHEGREARIAARAFLKSIEP